MQYKYASYTNAWREDSRRGTQLQGMVKECRAELGRQIRHRGQERGVSKPHTASLSSTPLVLVDCCCVDCGVAQRERVKMMMWVGRWDRAAA